MIYSNNKQTDHADVCLICPPFMFSIGPSLALGLLKATLLKEGISCYVDYADLYMTSALGLEVSSILNNGNMKDYLGEYVFSGLAGIEPECAEEQIFAKFRRTGKTMFIPEVQNALKFARKVASEQTELTVQRILKRNPKIVGISSCFQQRNTALAIFKRLKELRPDIVTVMGGANCFGNAGLAILREFPFVDYVFFGESDDIFGKVCKNIINKTDKPLPYGVLKNGEPLPKTAPHRIIMDMDSLPYPDYDDYFAILSTDVGRHVCSLRERSGDERFEVTLYLESSRGCWWGEKTPCTFCGLHGNIRQYRQKSAKRTFEEMCAMCEKYGIYRVFFTDCNMPQNWIEEFIPLVKAYPKHFHLFTELRSHYSAEQIHELAEAGFTYMQPGIESLSDHELKLMHKGVTVMQNLNFLKCGRANDIYLSWNIIYGFPGETVEDYIEQIELIPLIEHLQPPNNANMLVFARNNEYVDHSEEYGLKMSPSRIYSFSCPQKKEYIDDTAIYFDAQMKVSNEIENAAVALKKTVQNWIARFKKAQGHIRLDMTDLGDRLLIIDTRKCSVFRVQYLIGAERDVYQLCISPIPRKQLEDKLAGQINHEELTAAIHSLEAKKLLLCHDNFLFALAISYDPETVKQREIAEFQWLYYQNRDLRKYIDSDLKKCVNSPDAVKKVITQYAKKLRMCFNGEEYEKYVMPYSDI